MTTVAVLHEKVNSKLSLFSEKYFFVSDQANWTKLGSTGVKAT